MSLETVLRLLPAEPYEMVLMGDDGDPERDALLRRLGQLLGEEGVDEVLDRYGLGSCAMHAMGRVFEGWMAVNPDAATAAFLTLNDADANGLEALIASPTGSPVMFHSDSVQWKGQRLVPTEWGMFSRVAIWNLYGGVLRAATMADPKRGYALLQEPMLVSDFNHLVGGFTAGLAADSDWKTVHARLAGLAGDLEVATPDGWDPIPVEVAKSWARSDWEGAMDWLLVQETRVGKPVDTAHLAEILGQKALVEGVGWLKEHAGAPRVDDELLVAYAGYAAELEEKAVVFDRLSMLATNEDTKGMIGWVLFPGSPTGIDHSVDSGGAFSSSQHAWQHMRGEVGRQLRETWPGFSE